MESPNSQAIADRQADSLKNLRQPWPAQSIRHHCSSQRRHLCETCWRESLVIERDIKACQQQWKESKPLLKSDQPFLKKWLDLPTLAERYGHRTNTAAKSMLRKLLAAFIVQS
jgi:hypothetical protein